MPDNNLQAQFLEESTRVRADLLKIGVHGNAVQKAHYDYAWAIAAELVRIGVRGRFEGWLKNWHPTRSLDDTRSA